MMILCNHLIYQEDINNLLLIMSLQPVGLLSFYFAGVILLLRWAIPKVIECK